VSSRWIVLCLAIAVAQACVVDIGAPTGARIRVVRDVNRADTINAEPAGRMVVEISGPRGRLSDPVSVTIKGVPSTIEGQDLTMLLVDTTYGVTGTITQSTSQNVVFGVKFGSRAGPAGIIISAPEIDLVDSLSFTVEPGGPAFIRLKPGDTAVMVGSSFTQDAIVLDHGGDDLGLRPAFSSTEPAVTVALTGKVDGTAVGRVGISVDFAASPTPLHETAMVSVVPRGEIAQAVAAPGTSVTSAIGIYRTDGSLVKTYPTPQAPFEPSWSPDGQRIYYAGTVTSGSVQTQRVYALNMSDGSVQTLVADAVPGLTGKFLSWPTASRDGTWVYFTSQEPGAWSNVWRVHADGTGAEQLVGDGPPAGDFRVRSSPSPSPDGTRLAYTEKSVTANDVKILDIASGAITTIRGTGADEVRWSPTGERVATRGGAGLYVVNPDGTGLEQVVGSITPFGGLDWSSDGRWIVMKVEAVTNIVDPDSGLLLPVPLWGTGLTWSQK
jgi:dipeptidyl aminopeptidase/acylaminoacyl peptidase